MSIDKTHTQFPNQINTHVESVSDKATRICFSSAVLSLILLAALHWIKPELQPSWHMASEYAIGDYGWVMKMSFFFWAISCFTLVVAIRSQIQTIPGKIGLVLISIVGISIIMAGVFVMDSPMASQTERTTHGSLHGLASMIGIPGQPIAAMLISLSLSKNAGWKKVKKQLMWSAHLTWISLLIMVASIFIMLGRTQGKFGPDTLIGWPNRFLFFTYCFWFMVIARNYLRLNRNPSPE